jgi:phosphate butyryltransferase
MSELPEVFVPEVNRFEHIIARVEDKVARGKKCRAALLGPVEIDMLHAFNKAVEVALVEPVVLARAADFGQTCLEAGLPQERFNLVNIDDPGEIVSVAARMAREGEIDLIVNSRLPVADMLGVLFKTESDFVNRNRVVSHVAVFEPRQYKKLLLLTDSAVVVRDDLKTKLGLIANMVEVANKIGIENPRVAVLAAVEVIYPQMPVTMEAAVLSKMAERRQIKGALVDGPLSFDIAVDMAAAFSKGVKNSPVAGQADALLAPNIEVANGIYKGMTLYANCPLGGVIIGGRVPIALSSSSDSMENKFNSIVLGILTA